MAVGGKLRVKNLRPYSQLQRNVNSKRTPKVKTMWRACSLKRKVPIGTEMEVGRL
jgi:hypothetical protein